jgi:tRNA A-37 threonylcarbamoyl transferase component Bud32
MHRITGRAGDMSSQWIWPFELLDKLGEGGMGVVYRARYVGNDRIVAVKLLPNDVAENEMHIARFDRELEILKQLKHPNIVTCFGGVCESKQRFYAMELVDGGTLSELLRQRKKLSWDHVVEFGLQMCAGLHHAHERGVVHRDIKPGNFLLTKAGQLKLSDFGLATMVAASRITRAGKTAGTFLYMAPEQIKGQPPVSPQTDLYALGCVFYELLTGRPPFEGDSPAVILQRHLKETAPRVGPQLLDCPPALDQLVADLLQKKAEDRPASAAEVATRLQGVLRPSLVHIDPFARTPSAAIATIVTSSTMDTDANLSVPSKSRLPPLSWIAAVCLLAGLTGLGWWEAWSLSRHLREVEQSWATAAQQGSNESRIWALQQLGRTGLSTPAAMQSVGRLLDDTNPKIRLETLRLFASQPTVATGRLAEVIRIQKTDDNPEVRSQAGLTVDALRQAPASSGSWRGVGWAAIVLVAASAAWLAWSQRFWLGWRPA